MQIKVTRGFIPIDENNRPYLETVFINTEVDPDDIEIISLNPEEWFEEAYAKSRNISENCMEKAYFLYSLERAIKSNVLQPA